jgi:predicted lipid-binding transport protein (Tim44 family)
MGGQGRFLPAFVGSTLGLLAGGLSAALVGAAFDEVAAAVPLLTFPALGAVIAYELVHSEESSRKAKPAAGMEVTPIVSARPSGLAVGLVGCF